MVIREKLYKVPLWRTTKKLEFSQPGFTPEMDIHFREPEHGSVIMLNIHHEKDI